MKSAVPRTQLQRRVKRRDFSAIRRGPTGNPLGFSLFIIMIIVTLLSVPNRIEAIGVIRPTLLLILLTSVVIFFKDSYRERNSGSSTMKYLNILILYIVLSIPFVQWPGSVLNRGLENLLKAVVFFYFAVFLVDSLRRLKILLCVILGCQVIRVLEPLYLHVTTGYWGSKANMGDGQWLARLAGGPHDFINPNGLAFVILTLLPFLHYLLGGSPRRLLKALYIALLPLLLYAFVLTGSRSGFVGLAVVVAVILWRSKQRVALTAMVAIAAVAMVAVMSGDMRERYLSLAESGTRHSQTKAGRIEGTKQELAVGLRRPLFGHGLGTSPEAMFHFGGHGQIAHNLYTEALIEIGIVGLLLYLRLLASIIQNVRAVGPAVKSLGERLAGSDDAALNARVGFYRRTADAIFAWVVMCLVFSLASYGLSEFYWYMIAGVSVALIKVMSLEPLETNSGAAPTAKVPAWRSRSVRKRSYANPL